MIFHGWLLLPVSGGRGASGLFSVRTCRHGEEVESVGSQGRGYSSAVKTISTFIWSLFIQALLAMKRSVDATGFQ